MDEITKKARKIVRDEIRHRKVMFGGGWGHLSNGLKMGLISDGILFALSERHADGVGSPELAAKTVALMLEATAELRRVARDGGLR